MRQTVGILGTPIDILDTEAVLQRLEQFVQERRFHQVATANTDFLINALSDPELQRILRNADLVMPDGMPVVWAARIMRSSLPERVTGADIVPELAALAARKGYRVFMLGGSPEVAQRARARLEADNPGLQIVGCVSPPVRPLLEMDHEAILAEIACAKPDILLVAFGNPKQEKWIDLNRESLREVPVCIGVGGTFDFLAGKIPRAPIWMQRGGVEWFHRLIHEPRRLWKRYVRDILQFSRYLLKQGWAVRRARRAGTSELYVARVNDSAVLSNVGDFGRPILPRFQATADSELSAKRHLILDMQGVTNFDGEALGTLINLSKRAAYCGCEIRVVAAPLAIRKVLRRSQIDKGLFQMAGTVAQAFSNGSAVGMCWRVQRGARSAVVTACGLSDRLAIQRLESVCARLLSSDKQVDLDLRDVTFVDCHLLAALYRLTKMTAGSSERCPARFRVVAGALLRRAMAREQLLGKIVLTDTPEMPPDAVEEPFEVREEAENSRTPVEPLPLFAKGV
jgi:N-acetylglucosaminyldiphosphoundecaprenol N-acetyl-beta-D-mannosaminyltransferase